MIANASAACRFIETLSAWPMGGQCPKMISAVRLRQSGSQGLFLSMSMIISMVIVIMLMQMMMMMMIVLDHIP
jgi:hypothetical protein